MKWLGYLTWWSVGSPSVSLTEVNAIIEELDMRAPSPNPVIPVDAFRRITSSAKKEYTRPDGAHVTLDLQPKRSQNTMLVRAIVQTVRINGVSVQAGAVGECAFYKPPRGQSHRGRMRVTTTPSVDPEVEEFAEQLRQEYKVALNVFDPQAVRRTVRQYLAVKQAVYLGGPYFLPRLEDAQKLALFLDRVGGGSQCNIVPVIDDEERRAMLQNAVPDDTEEEASA